MAAHAGEAGQGCGGAAGAPAVETEGLVKLRGGTRAVDGVSLRVPPGSVHALLGADGAGRTTTLHVLATLLRPDGGTVRVLGHDVTTEAERVRTRVALTGRCASLDEAATGAENLLLLARLLGYSRPAARQRTDQLLAAFGLLSAAGRPVRAYPGGLRRRLDIAASIVVRPELVLLDEPTRGLDPVSRRQVWEVVRALARSGTTVLLATRSVEEAHRLADRVSVLVRGRVVAEGSPAELRATAGRGAVSR
ncbi:ATP-binding cassette domain-containing protein [Blastococcus sp. SYSU D00695]